MCQITMLLPGVGDRKLDDLGGCTPLEKAPTAALDAMEAGFTFLRGEGGVVDAFLALYEVETGQVPRAPLEAYSLGFSLGPNQRAYSARLVSAGERVVVDVSNELVSNDEARSFYQSLPGRFLHLEGPTAVYITGAEEIPNRVGFNPVLHQGKRWDEGLSEGFASEIEGVLVAHEINALRFDLEERPVNGLLLSEGGPAPAWGDRSRGEGVLVCTQSPVLHGAARALGMEVVRLPLEKRRLDNIAMILEGLPSWSSRVDEVVLDIPYLWQSTYEGNLREKVKTIEWLDRHFIAPISQRWPLRVHGLRATDITLGDFVEGEVPVWRTQSWVRNGSPSHSCKTI